MCLSMIINLKIVQVNHPVTLTAVGGGGVKTPKRYGFWGVSLLNIKQNLFSLEVHSN